jgi:uncharacterized membrane protein YfcA
MLDLSSSQFTTLSLLVFFAGVVDALAGGGGIITLPAYLSAGLNPALLLGTNKLSSSIGTVASALSYRNHLNISIKDMMPSLLCAIVGSTVGARIALALDPAFIRWLLLAALPFVAWFVFRHHAFGEEDQSGQLPKSALARRSCALGAAIGAYDGFFGPGTGTFFALALTRWGRHDLLGATARAKLLNLASNLSALTVFFWSGRLDLLLGLSMGGVSMAGHYVGARLGVRRGSGIIRPAVALVCAGLFFKLAGDAWLAR